MSQLSFWERLVSPFKADILLDGTCLWAVDIHSHLIPGIDDGIKDPEQCLICLTQLAEWGIQKIITTPHISGDWYPNTTEIIQQNGATVQALIDEHQLSLQVEVAAEYLVDDLFFDLLRAEDLLTFGPNRYVLIETGWVVAPNHIDDILFRIKSHGYSPVLAHPERYTYYHNNRKGLLHLRNTGCAFQLNWMSLTGRYGANSQKQARYLLEEGAIDFIGSDLHHPHDLKDMARLFSSSDLLLVAKQNLLNDSLL